MKPMLNKKVSSKFGAQSSSDRTLDTLRLILTSWFLSRGYGGSESAVVGGFAPLDLISSAVADFILKSSVIAPEPRFNALCETW